MKPFFVYSTINIEKPFSMRPDKTNLALPYMALEILRFTFPDLISDLVTDWPAFPDTDTDPIRHKVNTPV